MEDQYVSFGGAWFTLSLINAGLAQGKNRPGLNWWLVSLFIGPLATLLIVVWPPGGPAGEPQPGRMTRTQAIAIGAVVILVLAGVGAFFSVGTR